MLESLSQRSRWIAHHILPHEPALRAWLGRKRAMEADVDDIVQETYAALASLDSVDHILAPRAYMFRTAYSVLLRQVRRSRIVPIQVMSELDSLSLAIDRPSPETEVADRQELLNVARMIGGLPNKCAEALTLRKVMGLSQREAAQRMGVSESTIEKHVARGVQLLMESFGRGGNSAAGASRENIGRLKDLHAADQGKR